MRADCGNTTEELKVDIPGYTDRCSWHIAPSKTGVGSIIL